MRSKSLRWIIVAFMVLIGILSITAFGRSSPSRVGGRSPGNGRASAPSPRRPARGEAASPASLDGAVQRSGAADLTAGTTWSDNCLYAVIKANGQVIASQPAGFCRVQDPDQGSGTFYQIYPSGQDAGAWFVDTGRMNPDDGYTYWAYRSANVWLRVPENGSGGVQIKLASGQYEPLTDFAEQNPGRYNQIMPAELQAEANYRQTLNSAVTSVSTAAQSRPLSSDQLNQVEQQIQGLDQQNQQLRQQISQLEQQVGQTQSQAQNAGSSAAWQELYQTENEIAQGTEIWTEPECDFSDNGCAP